MKSKFVECDTCRPIPGTPPLCYGCLSNRSIIAKLEKENSNLNSKLHSLSQVVDLRGHRIVTLMKIINTTLNILSGGKGLDIDTFQTRQNAALDILNSLKNEKESVHLYTD